MALVGDRVEVMSRAELRACVLRLMQVLEPRRIGPELRVIAAVRHTGWMHALLLACAAKGAPLVPLDPAISRDELVAAAQRLAPAVIVTDARSVGEPAGVVHLADLPALDPSQGPPARRPPGEAPLLLLPSPDLARFSMLSEPALLAAADALAEYYDLGEADRALVLLPALGAGSFLLLAAAIVPLATGATAVLGADRGEDLAAAFERGLAAGATVAFLTPPQLRAIAAAPPNGPWSLRLVVAGGGPLPPSLRRRAEAALGVPIAVAYGAAETGAFVVASPRDGARADTRAGAIGRPLGCEVRIDGDRLRPAEAEAFLARWALCNGKVADATTAARPMLGEVLVRGPAQMLGYYKNPKLTKAQVTADGYVRTGDLGFLDPDGALGIAGRLQEVLVRGGQRIPAPTLETALRAHPAVAEAAALALRDEQTGDRIVGACALRPGAQAASHELAAWLRERLPPGAVPDAVAVLGRLPRSAGGAVSQPLLRGIVSGQLARAIYASLTRSGFRRAAPSDPEGAVRAIDTALRRARPVRFVSHWGAGPYAGLREVDELALGRLRAFAACAARVRGIGAELVLLLADVHASVNGRDPAAVSSYFAAIRARAAELSGEDVVIRCRLLGEVWREQGLELAAAARAADEPAFAEAFERLGLHEVLLAQAGRRAQGDPAAAARRYYQVCRTESPAIAAAYPGALWLTYADPEHGDLLPPLPRFYLFSYRRGRSERPWFVDEAL